jgi:hypothetical protein
MRCGTLPEAYGNIRWDTLFPDKPYTYPSRRSEPDFPFSFSLSCVGMIVVVFFGSVKPCDSEAGQTSYHLDHYGQHDEKTPKLPNTGDSHSTRFSDSWQYSSLSLFLFLTYRHYTIYTLIVKQNLSLQYHKI